MNVLVYVMDALRPDYLSCYGHEYETSPNIDAFATDAVRYTDAYTTATWTKPSAVSLLTGQQPRVANVMHRLDRVPALDGLLPRRLSAVEMDTHAISANYFFSERFGFSGFDRFTLLQEEADPEHRVRAKEPGGTTRRVLDELDIDELVTPLSAAITERLKDIFRIGAEHQFALAWSIDTHDPYFVRGETSAFENPTDLVIFESETEPSDLDRIRSLYRDMIRYNDRQFGEVLAHLRDRDLYDETLIILLSDHGESFGEHSKYLGRPIIGHNDLVYEEVIRIPLIIKFPGNEAGGSTIESPVQVTDVYPTILEICDLDISDDLHGRPLGPSDSAPDPERPIFVESQPTPGHAYSAAYRRGRYKAMTIEKPWPALTDWRKWLATIAWKVGMPTSQLFDLKRDPAEGIDLSGERPDLHRDLQAALINRREELSEMARHGRESIRLDDETERHLAAMGYRD